MCFFFKILHAFILDIRSRMWFMQDGALLISPLKSGIILLRLSHADGSVEEVSLLGHQGVLIIIPWIIMCGDI